MAPPIKIRLASRAYDGTLPILRGQKSIPGFEFDVTETEDVPGMFAGMFKGQYDVSEMSLGELIYYTSRSKAEFVAVPVFPSRMFRHGFIFVRKNSGINQPADLNGKKLGFLRWVQTAAIWMRGMLVDEYGAIAGLVTIEDVLEEIVGEIADEYDTDEVAPVEDLGDKHFRVSARLPIEDLGELYEIEFDEDLDVDTVGGLLALELGRVPLPGAEVTWDGLRLRAEGGPDHRGRVRIGTVLVSPTAPVAQERE